MTSSTNATVFSFDRKLLARMTGALGDDRTIAKLCGDLGQVFTEFLPDLLQNEVGLDVTLGYAGFDTGMKRDLIERMGDGVALSDGSLRNWCPDFTIACDSPVIITLMEVLLGAPLDAVEEPKPRTLSKIELDVGAMLFDKIAEVLKSAINAQGGFEPLVGRPYNTIDRPAPDPEVNDIHAASINMTIGVGPVLSTFSIVVPQKTLLKTTVAAPKVGGAGARAKNAWGEQMEEQVRRSSVNLEARIKLESLTLGAISRLQPGDVIPFQDARDVRVEVNANGRDLYVCEFGRSGAKYTVRIRDTQGSDKDILNHLMS